MEHNSDLVTMGKFISESTYKREDHELQIFVDDASIVLDYYDKKNKIIHEIKKTDSMENAHVWQVKYYISVLRDKGINDVTGELNYPKLNEKIRIEFSDSDYNELQNIKDDIIKIVNNKTSPPIINRPFCKNCSYYDLCYI